ncbi:hypothetical protein [Alteraurantiacibacter buctensis]|uniref:Uncharacterized protein n=1 Tax=Alteraurantiacibacter buctensis TaxID=1503981 RepID=A0A844Z157_9SPHN|nr:hypothetical protein [Alteraurantiacibacter buctensis]MXO72157.1 hypothetical protein [Alteraurantiacibacter buctensis]
MTELDWPRLIYLLMALGLVLSTWRVHRGGGKRTLVLVLAWGCIFVVAAGIAAYIDEKANPAPVLAPSPDSDRNFT